MRLRARYLLIIDLVAIVLAAVVAFAIRYEAAIRLWPYITRNYFFFVSLLVIRPACYFAFGLYRFWWRYLSVRELWTIVQAVTVGSLIVGALVFFLLAPRVDGVRTFSRSVALLEWMLNLLAISSIRVILRLVQERGTAYESQAKSRLPSRQVLIMGAGDAGALTVREMRNNPALGYLPVGFVDDDPRKQGARIHGLPVLGRREDIPRLAHRYGVEEVVIAMPTAPGAAIRAVRAICEGCRVKTTTVPGLYELLNGSVSLSQIRKVQIEDLLRREPVRTDLAAVEGYVAGAVVLVTGAGGSIGAELCRQIVARKPKELLVLGHGENSIYDIWMELRTGAPFHNQSGNVPVTPLIADVRDADRIARLFLRYRPQVVFHAAAHKHVPLMEDNPEEAFTTNVLGTRHVLQAAERAGTQRLVLISSDKAVNPVSVMGASKCVAELLVQEAARRSGRHFAVVRFGNVLGSRGSVVPLFERQIAAGGPVTITHADMSRYFMTIPEAVQLVLQAGALGQGGEVFVLDMGEPIRILDLAQDLISLSGLRPGEDVQISFTGLRPGEKLHEELFAAGEERSPTEHGKIWRAQSPLTWGTQELDEGISRVVAVSGEGDRAALQSAICSLVPGFCLVPPPGLDDEIGSAAVSAGGVHPARSRPAPGMAGE